ncbi:MAG TPA: hypothetical protein VEW93_13740 [Acidimicrobiales bacterium]|nr:hypothetical protein [Acidimicrobiales bacterium]
MTALPARTRRARALGLVLVVAVTVGASACNPGRPPAASIDGTDISAEHLDEMVRAATALSPEARELSAGDGVEGTYRLASATGVLQVLVERVALSNEARRRGIFPSPEDVDAAEADLAEALGTGAEGGADPAAGTELLDRLSDETRAWLVDISADVVAVRRQLTSDPQVLRDFYDANPERFLTRCYRVAQLPAGGVEEFGRRYEGGEDFGALSGELSTDPQLQSSNGDAGCAPDLQVQQQLPPEIWAGISTVLQGGIAGPFSAASQQDPTSEDVLFFEVGQPSVAPFEQVQEFLNTNIDLVGRDLSARLLSAELEGAEVRIDPRFGRWDAEALEVVAPSAPGR